MKATLAERLNYILPRVTSKAFLSSKGIGNEIACYIFDYPPAAELEVREHIRMMVDRLASHHRDIRVLTLNLLDVALAYLEQRGLLDKAIKMESSKGDAAVLQALKGPLAAEKIRDFITSEHRPDQFDLILISGVGSVWPMLRAHSLLNCLHTVIGKAPLVMFYPGSFDGITLKLFGQITPPASKPGTKLYYRAFALVPEGTSS